MPHNGRRFMWIPVDLAQMAYDRASEVSAEGRTRVSRLEELFQWFARAGALGSVERQLRETGGAK